MKPSSLELRSRRIIHFALGFCLMYATGSFAQGLPTVPAFPGADYNVLDPAAIPKYVQPLVIPPVMPKSRGLKVDYNIAVRQFKQQILPGGIWGDYGYPATTVWSYGKAEDPYDLNYTAPQPLGDPKATTFNYPALTVENTQSRLTRVRWINELYDPQTHHYLPHLLPVDRTLHWANPEKLTCMDGTVRSDCKPSPMNNAATLQAPYRGPVPIVTHVHGAHVNPESDGYPEAWWLPAANDIPASFARTGSLFDQFDRTNRWPGSALYGYYNTQRASTLWYHDHGLGITRVNVYAGPAGFWLIRGEGSSEPDLMSGILPGPAPVVGEDPNFNPMIRSKIREVPIVIQGRTFNPDGSLFFPDNRAYFEGLNKAGGNSPTLDIPFIPDPTLSGAGSDVAPIWNPEFFGNTMVVNGTTWPVYHVAPARYRFRLLNGCNARTLMLKLAADPLATRPASPLLQFYQIGSDGGLLPAVAPLDQLLMGPAERDDVVIDFSKLPYGISQVYLINEGPDSPFGGGVLGQDYFASDPSTTGQVMKFVVDQQLNSQSTDSIATDPADLQFASVQPLVPTKTRQVSLNELESERVFVVFDAGGNYVLDSNNNVSQCDPATFTPANEGDVCAPFGPLDAKVGTLAPDPANSGGYVGVPLMWTDMTGVSKMVKVFTKSDGSPVMVPVTETPNLNDTEEWEIWNYTMDAHPIHLHLVEFQVVNRELLTPTNSAMTAYTLSGITSAPTAAETGWKDTVIAYPGQATRIRARFTIPGLYVWHCHIIDHEDNEMMRPYAVVPDLNNDGCVDRFDLVRLIADILGPKTYDLNGDGEVDIADARRLVLFFTNRGGAPCR